MTKVRAVGLLGLVKEHPFPLTTEQRQELRDLERKLSMCCTPDDVLDAERNIQEFWRLACDRHAAELADQYLNVMLHAPSVNEDDEVLEAFLSKNPLITKVELFRLLIRATRSAQATFSRQKKKRASAGKVGGRSTPKNKAASELKNWVDGEDIRLVSGGVRAAARRLANRAPKEFHASLDDVLRVIEDHLKSKMGMKKPLQK
jgi:hypothetical protein